MTFEFFPSLLLGHMAGDYLLQNKWMAMNKSGSTWKCAVHCCIYSAAVSAATWPVTVADWRWPLLVFASHFPIDRWSLADKWLLLIRGRALPDFLAHGKANIPRRPDVDFENYHALRAAFAGVVYTAADNTLHLLLMYYGGKLLFGA